MHTNRVVLFNRIKVVGMHLGGMIIWLKIRYVNAFNKANCTGNWKSYAEKLTAYNKAIRKAKRNSFRNFCEEIDSIPAVARLHTVFGNGRVDMRMALRKPDQTRPLSEMEKSNLEKFTRGIQETLQGSYKTSYVHM